LEEEGRNESGGKRGEKKGRERTRREIGGR
jgi:hypothetical protein